jgi:preprotein translocase SecE subunit
MADETDEVDQQDQPIAGVVVKRRLRTSSSESVRERSEKAQQQQESSDAAGPNVLSSFWRGFTWPLRMLGRGLGWFGRFRVVRIVGRIVLPRYFRRSFRELRQVTWPNRRQSWKLTYAVIIFSLIFGALVAGVDYGLDKLFKELIIK